MDRSKLVMAQAYGSRPDAELAKSELESAGIPSMVQADTAGGMREHLAWSGAGFKLLVREEDVEAARELLATPAPKDTLPESDLPAEVNAPDTGRHST